MATEKISGYRNNIGLETILSQAPVDENPGEGAETRW
jgi:hypothetical protein